MIERGKAVALHKSVGEVPPILQVTQPDGSLSEMHSHQRGPNGIQQRAQSVQAIEERLPSPPFQRVGAAHGLYEDSVLRDAGMLIDGFATKFFVGARQLRLKYLAPGLRLPTVDELISGPLRDPEDSDMPIKPTPILLANSMAQTPWFADHAAQIPAGLYLDGCDREGPSPFEDGTRLVLPYAIGGNGSATTCDGASIDYRIRNGELYQTGWNPFLLQHAVPLRSILTRFRDYVVTGVWSVGEDGVFDLIERFQQADASEA